MAPHPCNGKGIETLLDAAGFVKRTEMKIWYTIYPSVLIRSIHLNSMYYSHSECIAAASNREWKNNSDRSSANAKAIPERIKDAKGKGGEGVSANKKGITICL